MARPTRRASATVLGPRALNRALLARQHLLARSRMTPATMVEHLVGMQAQNPLDPYTALWSRIVDFRPEQLAGAIEERHLVRMGAMRGTLHLLTDRDALALWPLTAGVMARIWHSSPFRNALDGVDIAAVVAASRDLLDEAPRTMAELSRLLAARWPDVDRGSLGQVARFLLPVVQIPPRGLWARTGKPTWATLEAWLTGSVPDVTDLEAVVTRYLGAFGPATVADIRTWSSVTGLAEVVERLRPRLVTYRDETGRELFDLPDAPRPDPDVPAPPRFLPEYDNLLLSHADRSRVIPAAVHGRFSGWVGTILIDGWLAGQWRVDTGPQEAALTIEPFTALHDHDRDALETQAGRLLEFHAPDAFGHTIRHGPARRTHGRPARPPS